MAAIGGGTQEGEDMPAAAVVAVPAPPSPPQAPPPFDVGDEVEHKVAGLKGTIVAIYFAEKIKGGGAGAAEGGAQRNTVVAYSVRWDQDSRLERDLLADQLSLPVAKRQRRVVQDYRLLTKP